MNPEIEALYNLLKEANPNENFGTVEDFNNFLKTERGPTAIHGLLSQSTDQDVGSLDDFNAFIGASEPANIENNEEILTESSDEFLHPITVQSESAGDSGARSQVKNPNTGLFGFGRKLENSFGLYQFNLENGDLPKFLDWADERGIETPERTPQALEQWFRSEADNDNRGFGKLQEEYVEENITPKVLSNFNGKFDVDNDPLVRDLILSTRIQFGQGGLNSILKKIGPTSDREEFVNKLTEEKKRRFPSTSARYDRERIAVLNNDSPIIDVTTEGVTSSPEEDSGFFNYISEAYKNAKGEILNALEIGQNSDLVDVTDSSEGFNDKNPELAKNLAESYKRQQSRAVENVGSEDDGFFLESLEAVGNIGLGVVTSFISQGVGAFNNLDRSAKIIGGTATAGAGLGTGAGSAVPVLGNLAGAGVGFKAGLKFGVSAALMVAGADIEAQAIFDERVQSYAAENGLDVTKEADLKKIFDDEEFLSQTLSDASVGGATVLGVDAAFGGLGSKLGLNRFLSNSIRKVGDKSISRKTSNLLGERLVDGIGGSTGEIAKSLAIGDEVSVEGVAQEFFSEVFVGATELGFAKSGAATINKQQNKIKDLLIESVKSGQDVDVFNSEVDAVVEQGGITEEVATKLKEERVKLSEDISRLPDSLLENTTDSREAIDLLREKDKATTALDNFETNIDPNLQKPSDRQALQSRIDKINKSLQNLVQPDSLNESTQTDPVLPPTQQEGDEKVQTQTPTTETPTESSQDDNQNREVTQQSLNDFTDSRIAARRAIIEDSNNPDNGTEAEQAALALEDGSQEQRDIFTDAQIVRRQQADNLTEAEQVLFESISPENITPEQRQTFTRIQQERIRPRPTRTNIPSIQSTPQIEALQNRLATEQLTVEQQDGIKAEIETLRLELDNQPLVFDFDETLVDTEGNLTPLGEDVKARIENGENIEVLTARESDNTEQIVNTLGIAPEKVTAVGEQDSAQKKAQVLQDRGIPLENFTDSVPEQAQAVAEQFGQLAPTITPPDTTSERQQEIEEFLSIVDATPEQSKIRIEELKEQERKARRGEVEFGPFAENFELNEALEVLDRYGQDDVSQRQAERDFIKAFFGNPESQLGDALLLRESTRISEQNGVPFSELLNKVKSKFESDGFSENDAAQVIDNKLKAIQANREVTSPTTPTTNTPRNPQTAQELQLGDQLVRSNAPDVQLEIAPVQEGDNPDSIRIRRVGSTGRGSSQKRTSLQKRIDEGTYTLVNEKNNTNTPANTTTAGQSENNNNNATGNQDTGTENDGSSQTTDGQNSSVSSVQTTQTGVQEQEVSEQAEPKVKPKKKKSRLQTEFDKLVTSGKRPNDAIRELAATEGKDWTEIIDKIQTKPNVKLKKNSRFTLNKQGYPIINDKKISDLFRVNEDAKAELERLDAILDFNGSEVVFHPSADLDLIEDLITSLDVNTETLKNTKC